MTILITNDDGLFAQGIAVLVDILAPHHDVWVVAPATQQSGKSHGITLFEKILFVKHGNQRYTCSGTPADCVLYTMGGELKLKPDLVISGINEGYNRGSDVVYSGTLGAAREAFLRNVPSIALSSGSRTLEAYKHLATFVLQQLDTLKAYASGDYVININYPKELGSSPVARFARLGTQEYQDVITSQVEENSLGTVIYHAIEGGDAPLVTSPQNDTDIAVTDNGDISISFVAGIFESNTEIVNNTPLNLPAL